MLNPVPKPEPIKRQKRRAQRVESRTLAAVRAACVLRDGYCRLNDPALWLIFGACSGESEFAHLAENRRFKTRGMAPQRRHHTPGTAMLCTFHHQQYDTHKLQIQPASSLGADGPLGFACGPTVYVEPKR